jgi:hypothetical protein
VLSFADTFIYRSAKKLRFFRIERTWCEKRIKKMNGHVVLIKTTKQKIRRVLHVLEKFTFNCSLAIMNQAVAKIVTKNLPSIFFIPINYF